MVISINRSIILHNAALYFLVYIEGHSEVCVPSYLQETKAAERTSSRPDEVELYD